MRRDVDDSEFYFDSLQVGAMQQLTDEPCDTSRKIPLGFPIPGGDDVTAYRERMKAGEYAEKKPLGKKTAKASVKKAAKKPA